VRRKADVKDLVNSVCVRIEAKAFTLSRLRFLIPPGIANPKATATLSSILQTATDAPRLMRNHGQLAGMGTK